MTADTRLIDMTVGELERLMEDMAARVVRQALEQQGEPRYVYGLAGIMDLYHCSKGTASKILRSGQLDEAATRIGRKIVVDVRKARELIPNN